MKRSGTYTSAILILLVWTLTTSAKKSSSDEISVLDWWQTEVIYQVYVRSFKDSNADGIGDLNGVSLKLSYIKSIGVGAIWLSPIMESPMVDFGYDISNYRKIDPSYGTMNDFDKLLIKAHKLGLKVLLDFVPNHTSNKHEWFEKSVNRIEPYTDYYIWKDAKYVNGTRSPPNNWISNFRGSAWEWSEERRQYYLHQFAAEQPDLNYRNPSVYEEMKSVLRFWLERGVDGFRVDAISMIYENISFPNEPRSYEPNITEDNYDYLDHIYTINQPETFALVQDWRELLDSYSIQNETKFMTCEATGKPEIIMKYYGTKQHPGAHFPFNFLMINSLGIESNATSFSEVIQSWYENMPPGRWANWVIGNHDNPRPATRFDRYLIDGLAMLQMLLPGTPIVYNGDELGMEDAFVRWDQTVDTRARDTGPNEYRTYSRDPERSPFQWDNTKHAGFTEGDHSWLPLNSNYWTLNAKEQLKKGTSLTHLQIFQSLVALRKRIGFQRGKFQIHVISDWVLCIIGSYENFAPYVIVLNVGSDDYVSNLHARVSLLSPNATVLVASLNSGYHIGDNVSTESIFLRPKASIVLTSGWNQMTFPKYGYEYFGYRVQF